MVFEKKMLTYGDPNEEVQKTVIFIYFCSDNLACSSVAIDFSLFSLHPVMSLNISDLSKMLPFMDFICYILPLFF